MLSAKTTSSCPHFVVGCAIPFDGSGSPKARGDMLGIDGIHTKHYSSEAVALSHCNFILLPFLLATIQTTS
jgi:hypothetical protein